VVILWLCVNYSILYALYVYSSLDPYLWTVVYTPPPTTLKIARIKILTAVAHSNLCTMYIFEVLTAAQQWHESKSPKVLSIIRPVHQYPPDHKSCTLLCGLIWNREEYSNSKFWIILTFCSRFDPLNCTVLLLFLLL
jgi:hypothetical protein